MKRCPMLCLQTLENIVKKTESDENIAKIFQFIHLLQLMDL